MRYPLTLSPWLRAASVPILLIFVCTGLRAQGSDALTISATAMGTSAQTGRVVTVNIYIKELSTPDDQKALIEAFGENGSEGVANALEKMSSKGRVAITGTLGYDLKYVRVVRMSDGSLSVRFVTDRPIRFAERWASARTMDYALSMGEISVANEKGKSTGTLVPAARFRINKAGELEIESLQSEWRLTNLKLEK